MSVDLDQVDFADLSRLWPEGAAGGARRWLLANVPVGIARNGHVDLGLAASADLSSIELTRASGTLDGDGHAGALAAAGSADRQRPGAVAHCRSGHAGYHRHRWTTAPAQPEGSKSRRPADPRRADAHHRSHAAATDRRDRRRCRRSAARRPGTAARAASRLARPPSDRTEEPGRPDHRETQSRPAAGGCGAHGRHHHPGAGASRWRASRRAGGGTRSRSGRARPDRERRGHEAERARAAGVDPGEAGCGDGFSRGSTVAGACRA